MRLHAFIIAACAVLAPLLASAADGAAEPFSEALDEAPGYRLGEGLRIGHTPLLLGGYAEATATDLEDQPERLALDAVALMLSWDDGRRFTALVETELTDAVVMRPGHSTTGDARVVLERAHVDYAFDDRLRLRVGKFLTPIGRWNALLHAPPLSWTTSRPLIIEATFPTNATGAMLHGTLPAAGRALEYAVYGSVGEELFPEAETDPFTEAFGVRLAWGSAGTAQLGASLAEFEQRASAGEHRSLYGVDFELRIARVELSGEWAWRQRRNGGEDVEEQGHYLQAVMPLVGRLHGVLRTEGFRQQGTTDGLHLYLAGVAWRARPGLVLKLEASTAIENELGADEGFQSSIALLF